MILIDYLSRSGDGSFRDSERMNFWLNNREEESLITFVFFCIFEPLGGKVLRYIQTRGII